MPKASKADFTDGDDRLKRKGAGAGRKRSRKAAKDPNKPRRPPSAFFVFMSEFREQYKKEHPDNKSVTVAVKAGGDQWKAMSDADKAPYFAEVEKMKAEYEKTIKAYSMTLVEGKIPFAEAESYDKSKSEVDDDDDNDDNEEEEEADE